ncbi:MAG: nucleoside hydrolase [Spirochaetales bacterium]|nr:nucleoside hydrolase [Spirochaetales bacterium]
MTLLIDTDPGHDDAIAIMTLLAVPESVHIAGVCTVAGNQTIERVTTNMLKIVELAKSTIPVAAGSVKPLARALETGADAHGSTGMDGPVLPEPTIRAVTSDGVGFLKEKIEESSEPVTILALGPLTNIATLLQSHPSVVDKIDTISLMGGGLGRGNVTAAAEFNFYVDPEAADVVFRSGIRIVMSGLDVTDRAQIYPREWEPLRGRGAASRFAAELLDFYHIYSKEHGYDGSALHDPCAAAWLIAPELFESRDYHIAIETAGAVTRGMSVADTRRVPAEAPNATVLVDVKREEFVRLIVENLATLDGHIESVS